MEKIIQLLKNCPAIYVGTVSPEGQPHVRPFGLAFEKDGQLFFSTSTKTSAYKDLNNHPFVEISTGSTDTWVRIKAKAIFVDDIETKKQVLQHNTFLNNYFKNADNPEFIIFTLTCGTAQIYDHFGTPPEFYHF